MRCRSGSVHGRGLDDDGDDDDVDDDVAGAILGFGARFPQRLMRSFFKLDSADLFGFGRLTLVDSGGAGAGGMCEGTPTGAGMMSG